MRIIGGRWRGKTLSTAEKPGVRPTGARVREAVFNVLLHGDDNLPAGFNDATFLDACCGTGAMGIEALSRGAARAVFVDSAASSLDLVRQVLRQLSPTPDARLVTADVLAPPPAPMAADIAYLDPPYAAAAPDGGLFVTAALAALDRAGWLAQACICVIERDRKTSDDGDPGPAASNLTRRRTKTYGGTRIDVLVRQ